MLRRFSPLLAAVVLLAGCGGSPHHSHARVAARAVPAVPAACSPSSEAMQCVLPPAPVGASRSPVPPIVYGVDFAWGGPRSCSAMRAIGARFAFGYWSYDSGKNWTRSLIDEFHACGIATIGGWETTADRATQGFGAGVSDAHAAAAQAAADGDTKDAIIFAVDCDCAGASILGYFQGVHSVLGARDDAYGGYYQILYLSQHGVVGHQNFQTYAWSRGLWLPASVAPLEQYLNGSSFDHDRAIGSPYGQFPTVAPPPPGPTPKQRTAAEKARDSSLRAYRAHHCTMPVLGPTACRTFARRVVYFQGRTGQHVTCWGKRARSSAPVCRIARPELSIWSHARDASERAYEQHNCAGPATFGNGVHSRRCDQLRQRKGYFLERAYHLFRAWT